MNSKGFITTILVIVLAILMIVLMLGGMLVIMLFPFVFGGVMGFLVWKRTRSLLLTFIVFIIASYVVFRIM